MVSGIYALSLAAQTMQGRRTDPAVYPWLALDMMESGISSFGVVTQ
jgi:hypothetical protein